MERTRDFKDKITVSGIAILGIGITLLLFTFFSAYGFLTDAFQMISTTDLVQSFGEALGPLIAASIRVMYLGVMGWIGSLVTIRGVNVLTSVPKPEIHKEQQQIPQQEQPEQIREKVSTPKEEPKQETKPVEPELVAIPLEEIEVQEQVKPKKKQRS